MQTSSEVKGLKEELNKARKERTADVNKRNEVIRRLKGNRGCPTSISHS